VTCLLSKVVIAAQKLIIIVTYLRQLIEMNVSLLLLER
jgi:hypothetical protein